MRALELLERLRGLRGPLTDALIEGRLEAADEIRREVVELVDVDVAYCERTFTLTADRHSRIRNWWFVWRETRVGWDRRYALRMRSAQRALGTPRGTVILISKDHMHPGEPFTIDADGYARRASPGHQVHGTVLACWYYGEQHIVDVLMNHPEQLFET